MAKVLRINSREYKLILSADRFADREGGIEALRDLVRLLTGKLDADMEDQSELEVRRTYYLDTPARHLRQAGYALRVRFEEEDGKYKLALKHRAADRYLVGAKDLSSREDEDKLKFEEDILPAFRSVFSQSNSIWFESLPKLENLNDAAEIYPGLGDLEVPGETPLAKVNDFEAHEVFCKLCKVKFGKKPKAKLGLSFWYLTPDDRWPLIAECAFDYGNKEQNDDSFPTPVVQGANDLFRALQGQPGWFDLNATTKTRYVYEGLA